MTVRIYHSSDASAPVLANTAGSMITVLDAVLVNGYGDKDPLGWTKEFSGTNVAVYRNDSTIPGSSGMYLRVDDTNATYALVRAYKTMSGINTGTDVAPNTPYAFTNIVWWKHSAGAGSPKLWVIIGDELTFYCNVGVNGTSFNTVSYSNQIWGAGDFISYVPSNDWNYFVFGHGSTSIPSYTSFPHYNTSGTEANMYIGRSQDLLENKCSRAWRATISNLDPGITTNLALSPYTGLRFFSPAYFVEDRVNLYYTGELRGCLWHVGRRTLEWFEDFGKPPGDPSGPTLRQFVTNSSSPSDIICNLIVKEDGW